VGTRTQVDVRWQTKPDGKRQGWAHVQFRSEEDVQAALQLSGQALMGREIEVSLATEAGSAKLNLGAPVQDCWFCLSNEQVSRPGQNAAILRAVTRNS
jgi:RNA recognition motif-containing protein